MEETRRWCYGCQEFNLLCKAYLVKDNRLITVCPACIVAGQLGFQSKADMINGE